MDSSRSAAVDTPEAAQQHVRDAAYAAREASYALGVARREHKDAALIEMAARLEGPHLAAVLEANGRDIARAEAQGTEGHLIDRLRLDESRVAAMAQGASG